MQSVKAQTAEQLSSANVVAKETITETLSTLKSRHINTMREEFQKNPTPELKAKLTAYAIADFDGDGSVEGQSQNLRNNVIAKLWRAVTGFEGRKV